MESISQSNRILVVQYFPEGSINVQVQQESTEPSKHVTFGQVKKAAGVALKLKPGSLKIFELFIGPLGSPQKLCASSDTVPPPGTLSYLSFQRLSFNEEEERRITSRDDRAMELIFWEVKEQYDANMILPRPKVEQTDYLDKIIALFRKATFLNQKRFVQAIRTLSQYYWSYYYRADACLLQSKITTKTLHLERESQFHVVMNMERLLFLDISGEEELASWPWHCLRCVKMQKTPQPLIKFEVLILDVDEVVPLRLISVKTDHNIYLYSLAVHILKIQELHFLHEHRSFPVSPSIAIAELMTRHKVFQHFNKCFCDPATIPEERATATPVQDKAKVPPKIEKLKYRKLSKVYF